ncbi:hypothetical protein DBV15_06202 [Temnothorax longispinosus]|uniref:Uncharacterized protein n=1 Tax=Temnothorax longispinosus TaxID=300112 RepID=A0A4S2KP91_9HYME|nr:hypothetical protein DBV15_06202 [Temnothorax longispinosus]
MDRHQSGLYVLVTCLPIYRPTAYIYIHSITQITSFQRRANRELSYFGVHKVQ